MLKKSVLLAILLGAGTLPSLHAAPAATMAKAKVSVKQAIKVAKKKYPGKLVGKVPLENEDGKMEYAVTLRAGKVLREVMVDAQTGQIADVEVTNDKAEAAEAKAEAKKPAAKEEDEKGEKDEKDEKGEK